MNSSITPETPKLLDDEIDKKKAIVRVCLLMKGVKEKEIDDILDNKALTNWPSVVSTWNLGTRTKKYSYY